MLSKEDLDRLDRLELHHPNDTDILWLCKTIRRLARLRPTEGDFPERVHLINNVTMAFPLRYAETILAEKQFDSPSGRGLLSVCFGHVLTCPVTDAFLCMRPYVLLDSPKTGVLLNLMEKEGRYTMRVDGEALWKGPLADILVGFDSYGVRRKPLTLKMPEKPSPCVFKCASDEDPMGVVQIAGVDLGVFLVTKSKVEVELDLPDLSGPIQISVGLVMARYTSKGILAPVPKA